MKLSEYRTAVNERSGLALSDTAVNRIVNEALQQLASERDWPWMRSTDSITANGSSTRWEFPENGRSLQGVLVDSVVYPPSSGLEAASYNASSDRVRSFSTEYDDGHWVRIVPTPRDGAVIQLLSVLSEEPLAGDTETPLLPDAWSHVAIVLACSLAHDRPEGDDKARERFQQRYNEALRRMERTARPKRQAQRPRGRWDV